MATIFTQNAPVPATRITAAQMTVGQVFKTVGYKGTGWYIRIHPSDGMKELMFPLPRAHIIVVDTSNGIFYTLEKDVTVIPAASVKFRASE